MGDRSEIWSRGAGVALLLSAGLAFAPAHGQTPKPHLPPLLSAGAGQTAVEAWTTRYVDQREWTPIGFSDTQVVLVTTRPQDLSGYPVVRSWLKWERFANAVGTPPRSEIWRVSVNCRDRTTKVDSVISYAGSNGQGAVTNTFKDSYARFEEVAPGTIGETYLDAICAEAAAARGEDS